MSDGQMGYWRRLWWALLGGGTGMAGAEAGTPEEQLAAARAKAATAEMDLRERDERIEAMQREYEGLKTDKDRGIREAGREDVERLLKKLAGPLSNLMAMAELAEAGQEVAATDLATLSRGLEKELRRAGLEPVGRTGERSAFDVAVHQRMSGGAVRNGTPVVVRMPGYRVGEKVLLKAMVSAGED